MDKRQVEAATQDLIYWPLAAAGKAKPAAAKGQYIKSCVAASTMGPGVKMNAAKQL